ncbi:F-box-like protein [Ceratobasidium sp. AG-Ba]|nr:F-box-like protein [Ceratobasidium sp. AG-Ba]
MSVSSSGMPHPGNQSRNIRTALDMWKEGRVRLLHSIEHYRATCHTLDAACRAGLGQPADLDDLENALATIGSELGPLETYEDMLRKERMRLATTRNTSGALVRINLLPPEVLTHVFKLSNTCYIEGMGARLCEIASVCTRWRWIALSMPELWTHIDIGLGVPDEITQLFLRNSRNSPIYIHLDEEIYDLCGGYGDSVNGYRPTPRDVVQTLMPHIHRVHTLDMTVNTPEFAMAVAQAWLDFGNPGLSNELSIHLAREGNPMTIIDSEKNGLRYEHPENALRVLRSVRVLDLYYARFSWDSPAYQQLTNLRISGRERAVVVKAPELFGILSSSPSLEVLNLEGINVLQIREWTQPIPITFNHLRTLWISGHTSGSVAILFSMMTITCECAARIKTLDINHGGVAEFFSRSQVARLALECNRDDTLSSVVSLLETLPHVPTIVLSGLHINAPPDQYQPKTHPSGRWPNMTLARTTIDLEKLQYIVSLLGVRNLHLENCNAEDWCTETLERVRTSLIKACPGLECSITHVSSAARSAYMILF